MPTRHRRASVTLTPALVQARERLHEQGMYPTVGQLALAGAKALLAQAQATEVRERRRARLRKRLAERVRRGAVDLNALADVRRSSWNRA